MSAVHVSSVGTYHSAPGADVAWTVNDTRGYMDRGPSCDECDTCECEKCPNCKYPACQIGINDRGYCGFHGDPDVGTIECIGLSFAFVCLDGGDSLCEDCAEKAGVETIPCNCN